MGFSMRTEQEIKNSLLEVYRRTGLTDGPVDGACFAPGPDPDDLYVIDILEYVLGTKEWEEVYQ